MDEALDEFCGEGIQGDAFEFAFGGNGNEAEQCGEEDDGEARGIPGYDLSGGLSFFENDAALGECLIAGGEEGGRGVLAMFRLEHEGEQGGVIEREMHVGAGQAGEPALEIVPALLLHGTAEGFVKALKAAQREGIEEGLFIRKMAAGRGVADLQFAAQLAQGNTLYAAGLEGLFGGLEEGLAEIAMVVGAG